MFDLSDLTIAAVVLLVFEILGVLFSLDAVMRPRSSQGAIAWGVSLIALPIITVPLYLVFGRTHFHGYAETLRAKQDELGESFNAWVAQMAEAAADTPESLEAVASVVRRLTSVPFTRGNRVELLVDGEATYRAMLEAIASAESYIFVQFFIVRDDETGRALRDALVARAKAGVRVHFLYDEIGSLKLPPAYLDVMREASIEVSGFKTTQGFRNRFQINFRNHRKLLIVDGRTGFIGGHNLGDEYLGYRDTHMRIDGPAAQAIQFTFLLDWYWATRRVAATGDVMPTHDPKDQSVAIVETGPADRTAGCSVLFATLINSARCRLWITSPYFVPDDVMVRSLQAAALRGVDVRVLVPRKGNHRIVELAASTYYASMIDTGVQFYKYHARFLHQKVILVDDALAGVGTVNLDNRSIYLNFEATGLVADEGVAREIAAMLEDDFEHSTVVERDFLAKKPPYVRVAARVARLASPLL